MSFSMPHTLLYASCLSLCLIPFSMTHVFLYASYPSLCLIPFSMPHTLLYASCLSLCLMSFSMPHVFLYASYLSLCLMSFSMPHVFLYASYPSLCLMSFSMPHTLLYASCLSLCLIPFSMTHVFVHGTSLPNEIPHCPLFTTGCDYLSHYTANPAIRTLAVQHTHIMLPSTITPMELPLKCSYGERGNRQKDTKDKPTKSTMKSTCRCQDGADQSVLQGGQTLFVSDDRFVGQFIVPLSSLYELASEV